MTDDKRVEEQIKGCIKEYNDMFPTCDPNTPTLSKVISRHVLKLVDEAEKKARVEEMIRMSKTKNFKQFAISRLAELEGE